VRQKTTEALKAITLQEFQNCFEQWKKRWNKCIDSQGDYFEVDYILKMLREIYDLKKNLLIFGSPLVYHSVSNESRVDCLDILRKARTGHNTATSRSEQRAIEEPLVETARLFAMPLK